MSVVPAGSLMHSGFGAHDPVFTNPNGVLLSPSANQPNAKDAILVFDDSGRLAIGGANGVASDFKVYAADLTTLLGSNVNTSSYASHSITTSYNGHFYVVSTHTVPTLVYQYDKYNFDGTRLDNQLLGSYAGFIGAVTIDESGFYYRDPTITQVNKFDTIGHGATLFATTSTGEGLDVAQGTLLALRDGSMLMVPDEGAGPDHIVEHRSSSGTLIRTFTVPRLGGVAPVELTCVCVGLNDSTFWIAVYDFPGVDTVVFREFDIATGTVINLFSKLVADPAFEWDGSFTIVRAGATTIRPTPVIDTPLTKTCCNGVVNTNTGIKGDTVVLPDWTPVCSGGGTVPTQSDLADVESWV